MRRSIIILTAASLAVSACSRGETGGSSEHDLAISAFPESLTPIGDGYPNTGDPCRQLEESPAITQLQYDDMIFVGCPNADTPIPPGGQVIGNIDGIQLIGISTDPANPYPGKDGGDVLIRGTDYHAMTEVECGFDNGKPTQWCEAGVKRNWGEEPGESLVEVMKPDGRKRAIFYRGTEPYGADSAQSDGSAGWEFTTTRREDEVTIRFGPETYVIVDVLVEGG